MRVYVITTRSIGEKYIFNSGNRSEIENDQIAGRNVFNDLNYRDIEGEDYRFSHKYYYKIADDNFAVIGYAYLPGLNNQRRVGEWKSWLSGLCNNGDEYVFVLHDKDWGDKDATFELDPVCRSNNFIPQGRNNAVTENTYIFYHEPSDKFLSLLYRSNGSDITATEFDRRFQQLIGVQAVHDNDKQDEILDLLVSRNDNDKYKLCLSNNGIHIGGYGDFVPEYDENANKEYKVKVVIHRKKLNDINDILPFNQDLLIYDKNKIFIPILHCIDYDACYFDIKNRIKNNNEYHRASNIMDSSIWNYCYSKKDADSNNILNRILKSIYNNYELGVYNLGAAYEFADINARLCKNSYLVGGHHSSKVVPFVFHSEYLSHKTLGDRIEKNKNSYIFDKKWRFLLFDDHAYIPMNGISGVEGNPNNINKLDIIANNITKKNVKVIYKENDNWKHWRSLSDKDESVSTDFENENDYIAIEGTLSINDFLKKLFNGEKRRYDIILLDYLLNGEYSYHLFSILKILFNIADFDGTLDAETINGFIDSQQKNVYDINLRDYIDIDGDVLNVGDMKIKFEELKDRIMDGVGPDKRLYFMYISSFTQSIQERLQDQLISRSEKYWFIGKGACPTNTPEIFLYNLYVLMEKRINTLLYVNKKNYSISNVDDFIEKLFPNNIDKIKEKCIEYFPDLLNLKAKYDNVKNDVYNDNNNGSLLVKSLYDIDKYTYSFWEHFQHLCYLIAYGNDSQYPEMWEEYLFVKDTLQKCVSEKIKNYIVKLSNQ